MFPLAVSSIHNVNLRNLKGNGNAAIDALVRYWEVMNQCQDANECLNGKCVDHY